MIDHEVIEKCIETIEALIKVVIEYQILLGDEHGNSSTAEELNNEGRLCDEIYDARIIIRKIKTILEDDKIEQQNNIKYPNRIGSTTTQIDIAGVFIDRIEK